MRDYQRAEMPSTILVAGGAGFVGSNLALRLRDRYPAARIVALDSLKRRGSEWNLPRLAAARIEFVHADIRRPDDLAFPGSRFDLLVDCSAEPAVLAAYEAGPAAVIDTNLIGTVNLLEVARRHGADVVFLSTSRVYPVAALESIAFEETASRVRARGGADAAGRRAPAGIGEAFPLDGARSLYGATKLACELLLAEYADMYGLRYVVDRCGVITGPVADGQGRPGRLRAVDGPPLFQAAAGVHRLRRHRQASARLRRRSTSCAISCCSRSTAIATLPRRVYNVGGGLASSLSLLETTALCEEITGNRVEIARVAENRPSDVRIYVTDNARVTADTGWSPASRRRARRSPRSSTGSARTNVSSPRSGREPDRRKESPHRMSVVVVTGSAGLIGSEAVAYFAERGHEIVGIDNDLRRALLRRRRVDRRGTAARSKRASRSSTATSPPTSATPPRSTSCSRATASASRW